jgi:threonine/homoserine/homoserine lactone efflux protein
MEPKLAMLFVLIGAIISLSHLSEDWRLDWQRVSRWLHRLFSGIFAKTGQG